MTGGPGGSRCVVGRATGDRVALVDVDEGGAPGRRTEVPTAHWARAVLDREARDAPRWIWGETAARYPSVLAAGGTLERCHDLRLGHAILARSRAVPDPAPLRARTAWDAPPTLPAGATDDGGTLFDLERTGRTAGGVPDDVEEVLAEYARQAAASRGAPAAGRLALLLAAESAGALVAAELRFAGIPWDADEHDRILRERLGPRPGAGGTPELMARVGAEVRAALGDPLLALDSPPRVLRALRRAGLDVASTSRWELEGHDHPAIPPLLAYKRLARLLTANGWAWMDEWVDAGRYRPVYLPGGVVTGRWASHGGGALQIPRLLRPALRADPGWRLVGADVAQLEPRVLAAMAGDRAMAAAGAGRDLYAGIVEAGIVPTRQEAKTAVLGALYGATQGDGGRLVPRLRRRFPDAMRLVDEAALTGERGGTVSTWLGRSSPDPGEAWREGQALAHRDGAEAGEGERARRAARDRGRFTRNFVVQGTAAEWALAWIAGIRRRLAALPPGDAPPATASGAPFRDRAHLAFFLHDEVIVHAPADRAEQAATAVREAAEEALRLLFPGSPVDIPLDLRISERSEHD